MARDERYDEIIEQLREHEAEDRYARAKREQFWYRQAVEHAKTRAPARLHRFATKVPCRATPAARALLTELRTRFPDGTVTFPILSCGRQAVMLSASAGSRARQIGWVEHIVQTDPKLCSARNQGLVVDTDGESLVLRFRYPATSVRMTSRPSDLPEHPEASGDFIDTRAALELKPVVQAAAPRVAWINRTEAEMMKRLRSREFDAFYLRFKREVQAGIWRALSAVLAHAQSSRWHRGAYYTLQREPDSANRRIYERTVDDSGRRGRAVDIGLDRTYDATVATDILLLYLERDVLADVADIYFALHGLGPAEDAPIKEEFFGVIRRFWTRSPGLTGRVGSDPVAVLRMALRAVPTPAQIPLVQQDWSRLQQSLLDRYGAAGQKAAERVAASGSRSREPAAWSFASFPAGEINVGVQVIYRQEWRHAGAQLGDVIRVTTAAPKPVTAAAASNRMPIERFGDLAARSDVHTESRRLSSDAAARLRDTTRTTAAEPVRALPDDGGAGEQPADPGGATYVYRAVQNRYDVVARPVEIQNVVLVAEPLPRPAQIRRSWVRRHARVLATVLLDESLRDTLEAADDERLFEHLRANILYYQRAIWQHEDPLARTLRYRKSGRKVPLEWRFELALGAQVTIERLAEQLAAANVDGQFVAYTDSRMADLDQVIDPAGPIGFYANYAVYRMRPEFGSADLFSMLHFFKSPYLRPNAATGDAELVDPEETPLAHQVTRHGVAVEVLRKTEHVEVEIPAEELKLLSEATTTVRLPQDAVIGTLDEEWLRPTPTTQAEGIGNGSGVSGSR